MLSLLRDSVAVGQAGRGSWGGIAGPAIPREGRTVSQEELVSAYVGGRISRRTFIRRLTILGVSLGAAATYAEALAPAAKAEGRIHPPVSHGDVYDSGSSSSPSEPRHHGDHDSSEGDSSEEDISGEVGNVTDHEDSTVSQLLKRVLGSHHP